MNKEIICTSIDNMKDKLFAVSKEIWNNPELGFEEFKASKLLVDQLNNAGFEVEYGVASLETAIKATHPEISEGPVVAILAEYDALPEIGHGCGHNLIATAALGACLALGEHKKDIPGKLIFMGTPAEEGGGGKIYMINHGLFKGVDAAMMFHPSATQNIVHRGGLAITEINIEFKGKTAHASSEPEKGINALDAVIQTFNGINALRQHITSDARIHGVITHGGVKPNIVPDFAAANFYIRALKDSYCIELVQKVENIAKGAALMTGAELNFVRGRKPYRSRNVNFILGEAWAENIKSLGLPIHELKPGAGLGSSDIGNVSHEVPTIHPYIGISETEINGHSTDFAKAAISEYGQNQMIYAAKGLAMTAFDVFTDPDLLAKAREEFERGEQ